VAKLWEDKPSVSVNQGNKVAITWTDGKMHSHYDRMPALHALVPQHNHSILLQLQPIEINFVSK